ncbi:MAG: hypothetical protein JO314_02195 [Acidobacteria bacterium]|nr:hypothetical protein [Acidobacteriota bacterium]
MKLRRPGVSASTTRTDDSGRRSHPPLGGTDSYAAFCGIWLASVDY